MSKKNRKNIVYSTNPNFEYEQDEILEEKTLLPSQQNLTVSLDRKQRKGKTVTLIEGFVGTTEDLQDLAKELKTSCGVGGNAKEGNIIIQGDNLNKIDTLLTQKGYRHKIRR